MASFNWNKNYLTGLSDVDDQHYQLVMKLNNFSQLVAENKISFDDISTLFKQLADYAVFHFKQEEALMAAAGIDRRHLAKHIQTHRDFIQEVSSMFAGISNDNTGAVKSLLDFLTHWLVYHILGTDQNMARQIEMIKSGVSPADSYDREENEVSSSTEPLLQALNSLFQQVSDRNKELLQLNQSLERIVAERTNALSEANRHLEELALTDVLTGLPNRRQGMRQLEILWKDTVLKNSTLSCMMIDADHFKEVNDTYGHDAGDLVLIELAKTLLHCYRNDDIVCRLGGDEFLISA